MDCQSLALALQDLSVSIQELATDPFPFVLHRTQCHSLAKSYALAVQHVTRQLHHTLSTCSDSRTHEDLLPSLSELHHAMLQGRSLMRDCLYQDGWVKKAVVLALGTEVLDVCLHDLVWCLCVIQQAMGQVVLQADEPESSVYGSLNAVWAETSRNEDMEVLSGVLQHDIACWERQLSEDNLSTTSRNDLDAQCYLAKFLLKKLSSECHFDSIKAPWDALPWADPHEFSIKEVIGNGVSAVVYEVEWHGQVYGQKEFFEVDRDVFVREAAIQARLRHPNILQLICCTRKPSRKKYRLPSKNRYSLVMELMDMDLRTMINNRLEDGFSPPFSLLTCVDLMLQIAKGMEHLHSLHIMHRDLKSLNLLVTNQASIDGTSSDCRMRVKIADFGMSKAKNQSSEYTTRQVGTTYWRAPEVFDINPESEFQEQPTAKYTKKADVYSFAMVCYEILSGKVPFDDGAKLAELHQRLLKGERPKLPPSCPPYLVSYIERCWHGDPEQRPSFDRISRTLRHLKGILLSSADPRTPLALSTRSCSLIEDELEQMMGSQWPSTAAWFSTRSMTISFEMSWYKVMEHKLTKQEAKMVAESWNLSLSADLNRTLQCQCLNLKHCVLVTLRRCWMGICCWSRKRACDEATSTAAPINSINSTGPNEFLCAYNAVSLQQGALPNATMPTSQSLQVFPYSELAHATNNFEVSALLGVGGFSRVYKGTLQDGRAVAVKVLSAKSNRVGREFFKELELVSRIHHRNLVSLFGYCSDGNSLMLVYEFMPRGDLGHLLYGQRKTMVLTWAQRYKIACGVASALEYLHYAITPRILHRDIKPSNILVDDDYSAHLADFGIALPLGDKEEDFTLQGSIGYLDPEYVYTLQLGPEIDVYSFGVVLLQLVSGRRYKEDDEDTVIEYVRRAREEGRLLDAVDERVRVEGCHDDEGEMSRLLLLGLTCCESDRKYRPTMREVVQILSGEGEAPILALACHGIS